MAFFVLFCLSSQVFRDREKPERGERDGGDLVNLVWKNEV